MGGELAMPSVAEGMVNPAKSRRDRALVGD